MNKLNLNKSYAILGLGISGLATLEFFIDRGMKQIFISETQSLEIAKQKLQKYDKQIQIDLEAGIPHSDKCLNYDYLIISPGISPSEPILQKAHQLNKQVLSEIELASQEVNRFIAITGTNGKSTTTAWIGHVLRTPPCGNIGLPFLKALMLAPNQNYYVCECSSFQLEHSQRLRPNIALITNISPDHISWHGSWEKYLQAKAKITQFQTSDDWLLLPDTQPLNQIETKAQILWIENQIQKNSNKKNAIWVNENQEIILKINEKEQKICKIYELPLPGQHNLENAMFVIGACFLTQMPVLEIKEKLLSFEGLEHRLEFVLEAQNKKFFNDSKATNPESTIVALKAFDGQIIWLAGGRDKLTSLENLNNEAKKKVSIAIFYGEAAERFEVELKKTDFKGQIYKVKDLKEALEVAWKKNGKIVLLSPACASFDQFANFEERGKYFKEILKEWKKKFI